MLFRSNSDSLIALESDIVVVVVVVVVVVRTVDEERTGRLEAEAIPPALSSVLKATSSSSR